MNPELSQSVTELKVQFQRQLQYYQYILQNITIQVTSLCVPNFRNASEVGTQNHSHTKGYPNEGADDDHGKLYIGKYPFHKWIDESVKHHWDEIWSAQSQGKDEAGLHKKYQDKKHKQAQPETTISKFLTKKSRMEASIASIITNESSSATPMSDITGAGVSLWGWA